MDNLAGFRLHRLEVLNWGTFHQRVWSVTPNGKNGLLTGEIGSGKSTLVDAVTTLLVPSNRIVYNKAAGADSRERSLRSYVLGYYRSERAEGSLSAHPVALRDRSSYSVILAHFRNESSGEDVTLAQVFWVQDNQGQPARFYVVADLPLRIAEDFAGFGSDITELRRRLRTQPGIRVYDHFTKYSADFCRRLGIAGDQALELFYQTVSMKSVGNLTEFVREHMLDPFPVEERIHALIRHFEDLARAHEAVLKAKRQIEALQPLVEDVDRHQQVEALIAELKQCRDALRPWFAQIKCRLLVERIERYDRDLEALARRIQSVEQTLREQQRRRREIENAILMNGGDRLQELQRQIEDLQQTRDKRRHRAAEYHQLARALGLHDVDDEDGFLANRREAAKQQTALEQQRADAQNALTEAGVRLHECGEEMRKLEAEIVSLRGRRSNITSHMLELRARLCHAIGATEEELPFAGELIQVRQDAREWEGAAERLLHNFGLSLLVMDKHYRSVAEWVDRTHLRGRLVYYRVRTELEPYHHELHPQSLVRKLELRPDSPFFPWLERELARRFDYACCTDLNQFYRERRAITRAGQIKSGDERHEKDDRFAIDDRTRFVLGWSNEAKIAALARQAEDFERQVQEAEARVRRAETGIQRLRQKEQQLLRLQSFQEFEEIDWTSVAAQIERVEEERRQLEAASDQLRMLQHQLDALQVEISETEAALQKLRAEHAKSEERRDHAQKQYAEQQSLLADLEPQTGTEIFPKLERLQLEALGERNFSVESCDACQAEMRDWLQSRIDAETKRSQRLSEKIIDAMRNYQRDWPQDTRDVDVSIEAAEEYRNMLLRLQNDDLPRYEARFRQLLRENTIREVAGFQAQLNRERQLIKERIEAINRSLRAIDYNENRYIVLLAEPTNDPEVRDFQESLRACTEGTLTGSEDDTYSEAKFLRVKEIIGRFQGREGFADLDRRWTTKVTDVRNWFVFSASERWKEDDSEHEHYTDSGGKSGGQKEKLAYTVLAASLAYQFGLESAEPRHRTFRFVVIDEAFSRGSDESAHHGLKLFDKLGLQLLVVTPLQKIHVIEPYVSSVAFVHNEEGRYSMVRNLTIEEYRAEQEARRWIQVS